MSKIKLLVADANDNFTANDMEKIERATALAEKFVSNNFDFNYEVNVIVIPPSYLLDVIPEDGISGRTYRYDLVVIVANTKSGVSEDFFYETLCHELSHSLRWKNVPEHSVTLLDDIMFEGLAITLEEKAMVDEKNNNIQYFLKEMQKTDELTVNKIMPLIKNNLYDSKYDYNKIFIDGDNELPRWAGYKLGYHLVKKYLQNNGNDINKATLDSYKKLKGN
jgi:hypothetical protein